MKPDKPKRTRFRRDNLYRQRNLVAAIKAIKQKAAPWHTALGLPARTINDKEAVRRLILEAHPDMAEQELRKRVGFYVKELRKTRRALGS